MMASHREQVLALVQTWSGVVPPGGIRAEHYLIDDLDMDGDDYGMSLVPELERQFGISPKYQDWEIETVGQLLEVVDRHVAPRGGGERR